MKLLVTKFIIWRIRNDTLPYAVTALYYKSILPEDFPFKSKPSNVNKTTHGVNLLITAISTVKHIT